MSEWLFLLLPVAAISGWWAAKLSAMRRGASGSASDPTFFRGLNYLLDEQPDKAIDVFTKLAEIDGETVEIHLALGSLFRRRGEVDRAIRIHQSLVSRPNLLKEERGYALFELGQDYMRAGLFDRAEGMFGELVEMGLHQERALKSLREIYQQEKDWTRCLEVAGRLQRLTGERVDTEIAHYHCELAEEFLRQKNGQAAATHLNHAQTAAPGCVRAIMLQARIAIDRDDFGAAAESYRRIIRQGSQFLPEILPDLVDTYRRGGPGDELDELERLYRLCPNPRLAIMLADIVQERKGDESAATFLTAHVTEYADLAGLKRLLELAAPRAAEDTRTIFHATRSVIEHLRSCRPDYQCDHCGFIARRLHWQCPSCKHWESVKPAQPEPMGDRAQPRKSADRPVVRRKL